VLPSRPSVASVPFSQGSFVQVPVSLFYSVGLHGWIRGFVPECIRVLFVLIRACVLFVGPPASGSGSSRPAARPSPIVLPSRPIIASVPFSQGLFVQVPVSLLYSVLMNAHAHVSVCYAQDHRLPLPLDQR
jgi:hypothetical protein